MDESYHLKERDQPKNVTHQTPSGRVSESHSGIRWGGFKSYFNRDQGLGNAQYPFAPNGRLWKIEAHLCAT